LIDLLTKNPKLLDDAAKIKSLRITIYEPAFGIIGDPAKRDPRTRQSADHSMVYIIATLVRKALQKRTSGWRELMLVPEDYDDAAIFDPLTRKLIDKIEFSHGGKEYDDKYPDGIPTTLEIEHADLGRLSSGLVMYPEGHARNASGNLANLLEHKFRTLASLGVKDVDALYRRFTGMDKKTPAEIAELYDFEIRGC
jgi:2-methylcitrate dehydratase